MQQQQKYLNSSPQRWLKIVFGINRLRNCIMTLMEQGRSNLSSGQRGGGQIWLDRSGSIPTPLQQLPVHIKQDVYFWIAVLKTEYQYW